MIAKSRKKSGVGATIMGIAVSVLGSTNIVQSTPLFLLVACCVFGRKKAATKQKRIFWLKDASSFRRLNTRLKNFSKVLLKNPWLKDHGLKIRKSRLKNLAGNKPIARELRLLLSCG